MDVLYHALRSRPQKFAKYFHLFCITPCATLRSMKTPATKEPTHVGGVRLRNTTWEKLRELMRHHGSRLWLEKAVDAAQKKLKTGAEK
jgi:undecaprenyl pyrophosphate synthase